MQMPHSSFIANSRLLCRSLLPSATSVMTSLVLSMLIVGGHLLLVTLQGKTVPAFLDEHALRAYTGTVVDPLLHLTNNVVVNDGLGILLWALFGWILYAIVAFAVGVLADLRAARQQVRYNNGQTVPTPMHRSLLLRLVWRFFISVLLMIFTIVASKAMYFILVQDYQILASMQIAEITTLLLSNVAIWMAILHGYVVLLRWYVLRTRVFGEILY